MKFPQSLTRGRPFAQRLAQRRHGVELGAESGPIAIVRERLAGPRRPESQPSVRLAAPMLRGKPLSKRALDSRFPRSGKLSPEHLIPLANSRARSALWQLRNTCV